MNAADNEAMRKHEENCLMRRQAISLEELEHEAQIIFPAGSLPDETDPIRFTTRENRRGPVARPQNVGSASDLAAELILSAERYLKFCRTK